jgi:hypothetical protein
LPTGLDINASSNGVINNTTAAAGSLIGTYGRDNTASGSIGLLVSAPATSSQKIYFGALSASGSVSKIRPANGTAIVNNGENLTVQFSVPIAGWTSGMELSNSFTGVDITVIATKTANQTLTANVTEVDFPLIQVNAAGLWNGSSFTAKERVALVVTMASVYSSGGLVLAPFINGVNASSRFGTIARASATTPSQVGYGAQGILLEKGETLSYRSISGTNLTVYSGGTSISITRANQSTPIFAKQPSIGELVAWVNFDGTTTPPTIRASGNVSSVARSATGHFTVSFTKELPDANYTMAGTVGLNTSSEFGRIIAFRNHTTPIRTASQVTIITSTSGSSSTTNMTYNEIQFYR